MDWSFHPQEWELWRSTKRNQAERHHVPVPAIFGTTKPCMKRRSVSKSYILHAQPSSAISTDSCHDHTHVNRFKTAIHRRWFCILQLQDNCLHLIVAWRWLCVLPLAETPGLRSLVLAEQAAAGEEIRSVNNGGTKTIVQHGVKITETTAQGICQFPSLNW